MPRNAILGSITLAISLVYFQLASAVPVSQLADAIGPQGLPRVYALLLGTLSLMLIVSAVVNRKSRPPAPTAQAVALPRAAGTLLIGVIYILVLPWAGYLFSIAALILVTSYYQGGSLSRTGVIVALGGGTFFWLLFVMLMGISMPAGIFPPEF